MKTFTRSMILGITLLAPVTFAATSPETRPTVTNQLFGTTPTIHELDVAAGSSVLDLLQQLQDKAGRDEFQYIAEPGTWQDRKLPAMRLRDITVGQIVALTEQLDPNLTVMSLPNGPNPVYLFRGPISHSNSPPIPFSTQVSAFGLSDPVERIGLRNAWGDLADGQNAPTAQQIASGRKKAMEQVLSLLEAAATQANSDYQATLKLHPETEVLLVRGTSSQLKAISESLGALQSTATMNAYARDYSHLSNMYREAQSRAVGLQGQLEMLEKANQSLGHQIAELQKENARLKGQVESSEKHTAEEKH